MDEQFQVGPMLLKNFARMARRPSEKDYTFFEIETEAGVRLQISSSPTGRSVRVYDMRTHKELI